jgi:hypothetical protein
MARIIILLLVAVVATRPAAAQIKTGQQPSWVITPSYSPLVSDSANASGSYYLLYSEQYNAETQEVYKQVAIKVLNENGLASSAAFNESFDPSYQTFTVHSMHLRRDGKVVDKLSVRDFEVLQRETNLSRMMYDGSLSVINNISGVRVGDIVVYSFTIKGRNKAFGKHFFNQFQIEFGVPTGKIFYVVKSSPARKLHIREHLKTPERISSIQDGLETHVWEAERVSSLLEDDDTPNWFNPYGRVEITDFSSWKDLSSWASQVYHIDKKKSPELRQFVDSLKAIKDIEVRVLTAIRTVQDKIRYLSLSSGINGYQPHSPSLVFSNRYGDCKDKSVLLAEILEDVGLEAQPVLVHTNFGKMLPEKLPSPWMFDHCIVRFTYRDSSYWVDPTINLQRGNLRQLSIPNYYYGLVVGDLAESPTLIPPSAVRPSSSTREEYFLDKIGGSAKLTVVTKYTGSEANSSRDHRASNSQEEIDNSYLNFYANDFPDITISKHVRFEDDTVNNVMTSHEEYEIPSFWTYDSTTNQYEAETYARVLSTNLSRPSTKVRSMPYSLRHPLNISHTIKLHMPEPWSVKNYDKSITAEGLTFKASWIYDGSVIRLDYDLSTTADNVPSEKIGAYLKGIDAIYDELSFRLTYTPNGSTASNFSGPLLIIVLLFAGALGVVLIRVYNYDPSPLESSEHFRNIGGWLILPAIGLSLSPFTLLYGLLNGEVNYFDNNNWRIVADSTFANYNPALGLFVIMELLINITLTGYSVVLLVLFWLRRTSTPRLAAVFYGFTFVFLVLDALVGKSFNTVIDSETMYSIGRAFAGAAIWIPYFLTSERAKGTFTARIR